MTGVEILSSATIYNTFLPIWIGAIAFVLMFGFIALATYGFCEEKVTLGVVSLLLIMMMLTVALLGFLNNTNDIDHIEYKVTIDNSVSMNEFLDKYEILDQEGKIYTVKEKE